MKKRNSNTYLNITTKEVARDTQHKTIHSKQNATNEQGQVPATTHQTTASSTDVQHGLEALKRTPAVRDARTKEIKAQIEAGTYQIDSRAIAHKMLGTQPKEPDEPEEVK